MVQPESVLRKWARVAISGRSRKTLDEAVRTIGNGVVAVQADVAKLTDVDKLYAEVSQTLGKIDVLFVNAGIVTFAPLAETTESAYDEQFDINIKGAYFTIQKALPFLNDGASVSLALPNFVPGPPGASLLPAGAWPSPARCRCFHRSPPPLFLRVSSYQSPSLCRILCLALPEHPYRRSRASVHLGI